MDSSAFPGSYSALPSFPSTGRALQRLHPPGSLLIPVSDAILFLRLLSFGQKSTERVGLVHAWGRFEFMVPKRNARVFGVLLVPAAPKLL